MKYRAMIFAAGRGHRMRPLTDHTPKPLLMLAGKPIIVRQIEALRRAGFRDIVINTAWLGDRLEQALGGGEHWDVAIQYSREGIGENDALETRGGIVNALSLLAPHPFVTVSGDIVTDFDYARLVAPLAAIERNEMDAHFVLADNPAFHPAGDFAIRDGFATREGERLNYANIACWHPKLFAGLPDREKARLFPWADPLVAANRVRAEHFGGLWENVGTPGQLAALESRLGAKMSKTPQSG